LTPVKPAGQRPPHEMPPSCEMEPSGHCTHEVAPVPAGVKKPAPKLGDEAHVVQVAAPTPLKLPAAQGEHALEVVPDLKKPALHGLHDPAPATLEELPGPQLEHEVAPASE
jgi:hypothetical protein